LFLLCDLGFPHRLRVRTPNSRDTMRRMAMSSWPKYTVIIGSAVLLRANVVPFILTVRDHSVRPSDSILAFESPLALLVAVLGAVVALIGTVGWAFHLSSQTLAVVGTILVSLAVLFLLGVNQMNFGFDDPTILFAALMVFAPGLIGVVCLLFASARRERASR
jgi:hypothetical protein